jgi:hypothetical protein
MTPADARRPMKADRAHEAIGCTTCHGAHRFDTAKAAVDACTACHDDTHTKAYAESPHARTVAAAQRGEADPETAVTCATCHMPRVAYDTPDFVRRTLVVHAQGANLNPPVKMARQVCMNCHGLGFSIDALAEPDLARNNFPRAPKMHVKSIEMAVTREHAAQAAREVEQAAPPSPTPEKGNPPGSD